MEETKRKSRSIESSDRVALLFLGERVRLPRHVPNVSEYVPRWSEYVREVVLIGSERIRIGSEVVLIGSERIVIGSEVVLIRSERGCDTFRTWSRYVRNVVTIRSERGLGYLGTWL